MDFKKYMQNLKEVFMHPENIKVTPKQVLIGIAILLGFSIFLALIIPTEDYSVSTSSKDKNTSKWTQEEIKQADDFIITLEAAGLVKERKNACSDGSKGCYYFIIDEQLWDNAANYETKQQLLTASEIYASSQSDYRFFEGKGYMSGKKLYDVWGIK